jgi:hypothetical protein
MSDQRRKKGVSRREALAGLLGGSLGALAPTEAPAAAPAAGTPQAGARGGWSPAFLSSHQYDTLAALAERIIPGSIEAEAARFVDRLLSVDVQDAQRSFLVSLSAFDAESLARYRRPFVRLGRDEQSAILDAAAESERQLPDQRIDWGWFAVPQKDAPPAGLGPHLVQLKAWISRAYYSSERGARELGWTGAPIHDDFPGCTHGGHA